VKSLSVGGLCRRVQGLAVVVVLVLAGDATAGVPQVTGAAVLVPPPASVVSGALESDTQMFVFAEREGFTLRSALTADIARPGVHGPGAAPANYPEGRLGAGARVNSYSVHVDKVGSTDTSVEAHGSITFEQEVLAILFLSSSLSGSRTPLGNPSTTYDNSGSEVVLPGTLDAITLSDDRRTVSLDIFTGGGSDNVRIVTLAPQALPVFAKHGLLTAALLLLGLSGVVLRRPSDVPRPSRPNPCAQKNRIR
jgi:hypothetical protein